VHSWFTSDDDEPIDFDRMATRQRAAQAAYRVDRHVALDQLMDMLDAKEHARIALLEPPFPRNFDAVVAKTMADRRAHAHAELDSALDAAIADAELHLEVMRRHLHDKRMH